VDSPSGAVLGGGAPACFGPNDTDGPYRSRETWDEADEDQVRAFAGRRCVEGLSARHGGDRRPPDCPARASRRAEVGDE